MNITIYLGPLKGGLVDATHIETGNPGIGGTQYCMMELAHYLNHKAGYEVSILSSRPYLVEKGISFMLIEGDSDVCEVASSIATDVLILSQFNNKTLEDNIRQQNFNVIVWSHNYILFPFCKFISETRQVVCNVFVGKQLYDRYIDDDVIKKSVFIYNMYTDKHPDIVRENDQKTVVYMGAIIPGKGFAELCRIWPKILQKVPTAQLIVLGSGKLYGDAKLGKLGIAAEEYENTFSQYITNNDGTIIPSVKFLGVVGYGKEEIFRKACVGVVNPTGRTETFGMGVLEMGEAKLPVITIGKNGYFDTVNSGMSGILSKNMSAMVDDIVTLLTDPVLNAQYGEENKRNNKRFLPEVIGPQWEQILLAIDNNNLEIKRLSASKPYCNNHKWARILNNKLRFGCHLSFLPSVVRIESFLYKLFISVH